MVVESVPDERLSSGTSSTPIARRGQSRTTLMSEDGPESKAVLVQVLYASHDNESLQPSSPPTRPLNPLTETRPRPQVSISSRKDAYIACSSEQCGQRSKTHLQAHAAHAHAMPCHARAELGLTVWATSKLMGAWSCLPYHITIVHGVEKRGMRR